VLLVELELLASSTVTMRSSAGMNDDSTLSVVVLPGAGTAGDDDVEPTDDARLQEAGRVAFNVPKRIRSSICNGSLRRTYGW
jgi:hypothetical protein